MDREIIQSHRSSKYRVLPVFAMKFWSMVIQIDRASPEDTSNCYDYTLSARGLMSLIHHHLVSQCKHHCVEVLQIMGDEGVKVSGIRQIVRLREMLQRWQYVTLGSKDNRNTTSVLPPAVDKRLKNVSNQCDSDEESCHSPEIPPDVPKGYCPVYIGPERRRFVIPTRYLSLPVFKLLLEKAEEEFGFDHKGALTIPCEIETFKYILKCMEQHAKGLIDDEGNPTGLKE